MVGVGGSSPLAPTMNVNTIEAVSGDSSNVLPSLEIDRLSVRPEKVRLDRAFFCP